MSETEARQDVTTSETRQTAAETVEAEISAVHYQILGGAGLVLVFFAQLDQGLLLGNLLVACVGLLGIVAAFRVAPLAVLGLVLIVQAVNHLALYGNFLTPQQRPWLHLGDLLLAIGVLGYVAAHYRLQAIRRHALPIDPRQRRRVIRPDGLGSYRQALRPRAESLLTPQEVARFVLALPAAAIAGQLAWIFLTQNWLPPVFHERLMRLLVALWALGLGLLLTAWLLQLWRWRQMSAEAAQIFLQDTLWKETRREQRRMFRWLAWRKVRQIDQST